MNAGQPFRVLITGSRTWHRTHIIAIELVELHAEHGDRLTIVHGACPRGADAIADAWCARRNVTVERHPANWAHAGRTAGFTRNAAMVNAGADLCLAFIRDDSPGASHCAELAERSGIRTIRHEHHDPRVLNKHQVSPDARRHTVYVGRGSRWGNPFRIGPDGDRATVITAYQRWLRNQRHLLTRLDELAGHDLLCWCAPLPCHADLLLWLANTSHEQRLLWWRTSGNATGDGGAA
jgi:hypothetical protein